MNNFHVQITDAGRLEVNLYDLLGTATGEQRAALIDALACQQEVIDEVMNQVLDGMTTAGSHGPSGGVRSGDERFGIDGARLRIAKQSSEITAKVIQELARRIDAEQALGRKGWDAYHELLDIRSR